MSDSAQAMAKKESAKKKSSGKPDFVTPEYIAAQRAKREQAKQDKARRNAELGIVSQEEQGFNLNFIKRPMLSICKDATTSSGTELKIMTYNVSLIPRDQASIRVSDAIILGAWPSAYKT